MGTPNRTDPQVNELWDDFHAYVNVNSAQLRDWLLTRGSGDEAFRDAPDRAMPEPGGAILAVLGRRKVDLTEHDMAVMRTTVDQIETLLEARPPNGATDDTWRHALLDLGHDPLHEPT